MCLLPAEFPPGVLVTEQLFLDGIGKEYFAPSILRNIIVILFFPPFGRETDCDISGSCGPQYKWMISVWPSSAGLWGRQLIL